MNEPDQDKALEEAAKALFDDSVERLDAATLSKLNQSRQRALEELDRGRVAGRWVRWAPATGVVAAAIVAVVVMRGPDGVEPVVAPVNTAADFEILLGDDSLEMLEDLEFYAWIDDAVLDDSSNAG